ncbi:MAG: hypothetical protein AAGK23_07775 [Pseudomonadota bacterium]
MRTYVIFFAFSLLVACASGPTPYQPATSETGFGYTEQPIETGRYRVTYRGKTPTEARTLALRRAAELTFQDGKDWFQVVDSYTQVLGSRGGGSSVSIGGGTGGRNSGIGVGIGFPIGGSSAPGDTEIGLEIITGTGETPDNPDAYTASSVLENAIVR